MRNHPIPHAQFCTNFITIFLLILILIFNLNEQDNLTLSLSTLLHISFAFESYFCLKFSSLCYVES